MIPALTPAALQAELAAEAAQLAHDARQALRLNRRADARHLATWAGVAAGKAAIAVADNPFEPELLAELHAAWNDGRRMGLAARLPLATVHPLPARALRTAAAITHEVMP